MNEHLDDELKNYMEAQAYHDLRPFLCYLLARNGRLRGVTRIDVHQDDPDGTDFMGHFMAGEEALVVDSLAPPWDGEGTTVTSTHRRLRHHPFFLSSPHLPN